MIDKMSKRSFFILKLLVICLAIVTISSMEAENQNYILNIDQRNT